MLNLLVEQVKRRGLERSAPKRKTARNPYVLVSGTLDSGFMLADMAIEMRELHPEVKRITRARAQEFYREMENKRDQKIPISMQKCYKPDYDALRRA